MLLANVSSQCYRSTKISHRRRSLGASSCATCAAKHLKSPLDVDRPARQIAGIRGFLSWTNPPVETAGKRIAIEHSSGGVDPGCETPSPGRT